MLATITDTITNALTHYGYAAVFLLMTLESACIPIPSEVTMLFGGALTSAAFAGGGNQLALVGVIPAGVLGNLVGSWLAYGAGAAGGRPFVDRYGRYLLIRPHEVDRAHGGSNSAARSPCSWRGYFPWCARSSACRPAWRRCPSPDSPSSRCWDACHWSPRSLCSGISRAPTGTRSSGLLAPFSLLILAAIVVMAIVYVARRWKSVRAEYAALDAAKRH